MIRRPPRSPQTHTLSLHDALPIERRTRSFGWTYDFTTGRFAPADPIPDWLTECRERAAQFAGIAPEQLVQALLIPYAPGAAIGRSEEHTSELQSLMRISSAVFCLKKKNKNTNRYHTAQNDK